MLPATSTDGNAYGYDNDSGCQFDNVDGARHQSDHSTYHFYAVVDYIRYTVGIYERNECGMHLTTR